MPQITSIKPRRGTAAQWTATDPVLGEGEWGYESDTGMSKMGDGVNGWGNLPYAFGGNPNLVPDKNLLESIDLYVYGNSYTQAPAVGRATLGGEWPARVAARLNMGTVYNRGYSGSIMGQLAYELNNNVSGATPTRGWSAGAKGLVVIEESINDTVTFGSSAKAQTAYTMALRTMIEQLSAATRYDAPNATFTYGGTWTTGTTWLKNSGKRTTVVGSTCTFTINGDNVTLYWMGMKDASSYAVLSVKQGSTTLATIDTRSQMDTYNSPGSVGTGIASNLCCTRITGLGAGNHTIVITLTSIVGADGFYFDGYTTRNVIDPPQIILLKEGLITNYNPNGSSAIRQQYNALMDSVALEYVDNVTTVHVDGYGWDSSCLYMSDGTGNHPNDKGNKILTDAVCAAALSLGFRDGMHILA